MYLTWEFLPYLFLLMTAALSLLPSGWVSERVLRISFTATLIIAILVGTVNYIGAGAILGAGFLLVAARKGTKLSWIYGFIFFGLALALMLHKIPGFHNLLFFDKVHFSPDSRPFSMYLNFDKVILGLIIFIFLVRPQQEQIEKTSIMKATRTILVLWLVTSLVLAATALASNYVRIDLKWPEGAWVWAINNFFFVCLAEEAFFRGLIMRGLQAKFVKHRYKNQIAIGVSSIAFGLAHFAGGWHYVLLASIAGVFYGLAAILTGRIQAAMVVHFGLNLVHFICLSYPALSV